MSSEFTRDDECPACRAKPGSPYLCGECIERRTLRAEVERLTRERDEARAEAAAMLQTYRGEEAHWHRISCKNDAQKSLVATFEADAARLREALRGLVESVEVEGAPPLSAALEKARDALAGEGP